MPKHSKGKKRSSNTKNAEPHMSDHHKGSSQNLPVIQDQTRNSNPGFTTVNVQETLKMDDSVGRLLDKQFQPAAMLLGGIVTVVVFVASGLFWFDGTVRSKVHDAMQNEMTILHTRDDELSRFSANHDERIKKLEASVTETQQTLAIMKQVQSDMRDDVKEIKSFMRSRGVLMNKSQ